MKSVYESVDDVDLYIGGVTEKPLPNAELGPTFAGIFALQFLNLKRTDRFFYTHNIDKPTGFSSSINKHKRMILSILLFSLFYDKKKLIWTLCYIYWRYLFIFYLL